MDYFEIVRSYLLEILSWFHRNTLRQQSPILLQSQLLKELLQNLFVSFSYCDIFLSIFNSTHITPIHIKRSANVALRHSLTSPYFLYIIPKLFTYQHNHSIRDIALSNNLVL